MTRWASLHLRLPPRTPSCTASCHMCLGESQSDTLAGVLEREHEVGVSRGKLLAAAVVLSRPEACRSPDLAGTQGASRQAFLVCLEWPSRQAPLAGVWVGLPGKLLLPGPWLAFPASSSCRGLGQKHFVLEWLQGNHGGSWRSPASLAAGCCNCPCTSLGY